MAEREQVDHKKYPWTLLTKYQGANEYVPEESFPTLELAKEARNRYKAETPTDKFIINRTKTN